MKKLILICTLTLVMTFTGVFGDTGSYDVQAVDGVGYNVSTGDRDTTGYYSISNKLRVLSDTITLNSLDNFHYMVFFNKNNQVIGFMNNDLQDSQSIDDSYDLGTITTTTVTIPEGAYSFAFQTFNYDGYVDGILEELWPESYTITTDQTYTITSINDTVYTANGNEYTLADLFGTDYSTFGGSNNLIENGDMTLDTNSDGVADNFSESSMTNSSVSDGVQYGEKTNTNWNGYDYLYNFENHEYYVYAEAKGLSLLDVSFNVYTRAIDFEYFISYTDLTNQWQEYSGTLLSSGNDIMISFRTNGTIGDSLYLDNIRLYDLTTLTTAGDEPTAEQFEDMYDAWLWFDMEPERENFLEFLPLALYDCSTEPNPWATIWTHNADSYVHYCYDFPTYSLAVNGWEWETVLETYGIGELDLDSEFKAGSNMFYTMGLALDNEPNTIDIKIGLDGDSFYYNSHSSEFNIPFTEPTDANHYFAGLIENEGNSSANFSIDYNYYLPANSDTDLQLLFGLVFNPYSVFGDDSLSYETILTYLWSIQNPWSSSGSYDDTYNRTVKGIILPYYTITGWGYDESMDSTNIESITVSYSFTPPVYDRDLDTDVDDYLGNLGLNDSQSKFILGVSIIIIFTIILGITTKSGAIILLGDTALYLTFVFMGWFPSWVAILIGLGLVVIFAFSLSNKGGNIE